LIVQLHEPEVASPVHFAVSFGGGISVRRMTGGRFTLVSSTLAVVVAPLESVAWIV
jgi:hypothetical protein